jgi:hypothetical protein
MDGFESSAYAGERYQAVVPDTLELADRAALALNGLGGVIDPDLHYQMHFLVRYATRKPSMQHHGADTTCDPKLAESFTMMRLMCGSDQYLDLEAAQREELVSRIADGLYWNRVDPARPWRTSYNPAFDGARRDEDLSNVVGVSRMLRALLAWRELVPDPRFDRLIRELVGGLRRIAIFRDDYAYTTPMGALASPSTTRGQVGGEPTNPRGRPRGARDPSSATRGTRSRRSHAGTTSVVTSLPSTWPNASPTSA